MIEIVNKLLDQLTGIDFWIAASALIIILARWWYLNKTKKAEQKIAKRQISFTVVMTVIAVLVIAVHRLFFSPNYTFPKDVAGILVLRIEGDDENNSLQRLLVSSLNNSIRKEAAGQKIEIRAQNEIVTETMGLPQAHTKARKIGKACKAILVIWGNRVGDKTFFPRLTVVGSKSSSFTSGQWALAAQDVTELALPSAQVDQPIYLKHFVIGYAFYNRKDYASALAQFKAALNQSVINPVELNEIRIYCGNGHYYLAQGQRDMASQLQQAIAYYDTALSFYKEQDFPEQWATTQNNLGRAYVDLPTGDRSVNLQKAIAFLEATLRVYNEKGYPVDWAMTQNNLGVAYFYLPIGNRSKNLQKAMSLTEAALRVYTEKDNPENWALIQNNLGATYASLPTGDHSENLQKAIAFYEAALRVRTEKDFPVDWARTQNNLGRAYADLPTGDRTVNLQKAIAFYEAALRVRTEKDFPEDWARTQKNLGDAYAIDLGNANAYAGILSGLLKGTNNVNLQKAIVAYEAALRVYTEKDFPEEWAEIQNIRGGAYLILPTGDHSANLQKAIAACEAALRVYTEKDFRVEWAATQSILGAAYLSLPTGHSDANMNKAIAAFEAASRVLTEKDYPLQWAMSQLALGGVYTELSTGSKSRNLQKAIAYFENALKIFTTEAYPELHNVVTEGIKDAQNAKAVEEMEKDLEETKKALDAMMERHKRSKP